MDKISYKNEIYRKLIHLSSLWMPFVIYVSDRALATIIFCILFICMMIFEYIRFHPTEITKHIIKCFMPLLREHEKKCNGLTGATYMVGAALLLCLLFTKMIAVMALCIMLIGDTAASLVGRKFGKTKLFEKSMEGFSAFIFFAGFAVVILTSQDVGFPSLTVSILSVIVAAIVELFSSRIKLDDNFSVTIAAAAALSMGSVFISF